MSAALQATAPLASPYKRQTPTLLQAFGHSVQAFGRSIWDALAASGHRRAARELRELAQRWESVDGAVAQQLRQASRFDTRP